MTLEYKSGTVEPGKTIRCWDRENGVEHRLLIKSTLPLERCLLCKELFGKLRADHRFCSKYHWRKYQILLEE